MLFFQMMSTPTSATGQLDLATAAPEAPPEYLSPRGSPTYPFSVLGLKLFVLLGDLFVVFLGLAVARRLFLDEPVLPSLSQYAALALSVIVGVYLVEGYETRTHYEKDGVVSRFLLGLGASVGLLVAFLFVFPSLPLTRRFAFFAYLYLTPLFLAWRIAGSRVLRARLPRRRVAILGDGDAGARLEGAFSGHDAFSLAMIMDEVPEAGEAGDGPVPDPLAAVCLKRGIDLLVVALPKEERDPILESLVACRGLGIEVQDMATCFEILSQKIPVRHLEDEWVAFSSHFLGWGHDFEAKVKRLLDIVISFVLGVVAAPFVLVLALLIRLTSPGPALLGQKRVGKHGKVFTLYKLRSMRDDAEEDGKPVWAAEDDHRVTPVGWFLRKAHLDELPQLWNVFRGDMSLVGPRPERPEFVKELRRQIPYYDLRHVVKPGLTGWAQVKYPYGASEEDALAKLEYDLYYLRHKTLLWDFRILLRTFAVSVLGKGSR